MYIKKTLFGNYERRVTNTQTIVESLLLLSIMDLSILLKDTKINGFNLIINMLYVCLPFY